MNPFEFVIAILVIVFGARLARDYFQHRGVARSEAPGEDARMLADEVRQLRERVQVLERVVTDGHPAADLDHQIERLRER